MVVRRQSTLVVSGPDANSWLNGLVTCDVSKVSDGVGVWGLLLSKRGKIVAELTVVSDADRLLLGTSGDSSELARQLDDFLVMEDVQLEDRADDFTWIQLHGEGAPEAAKRFSGEAIPRARVDWLPAGGAALVVPRSGVDACLEAIHRSGDVRALDQDSWQAWRVAHCLPEFGVDFGPNDNPHQAGLDRRAVNWTKGCYLGQEVVCMQDMRGKVKRRLTKLALPEGLSLEPGNALSADSGDPVGSVTSVTGPSLPPGEPRAAIARLQAPHFEPGHTVYVGKTPLVTAPLWA
jgi:folate-binding protein YgfZ